VAGFDGRRWPDFWDFTTSPPMMRPVDIPTADPAELIEIMYAYPDPGIAYAARERCERIFCESEFWGPASDYHHDDG